MFNLKSRTGRDEIISNYISWGHWFALFNMVIVILVGSRYFVIADWPPTLLGRVYAMISGIGYFGFLAFIVYLIFLFPLSFFIRSIKWLQIIAVLIATFGITVLLLDIQSFALYRIHLDLPLIDLLIHRDDVPLYARWQQIFLYVPFIVLIEMLFAVWSWRKLRSLTKRKRYVRPLVIFWVFSFLMLHVMHIWADATFYRPITMQRASLPFYSPVTARQFLKKIGALDSEQYQTADLVPEFSNTLNANTKQVEYPLGEIKLADRDEESPLYNILLITLEHWPQMDAHFPKLEQFAQKHSQFMNHYTASPYPELSRFALWFGLDPNYRRAIDEGNKVSVLASTAYQRNYVLSLFNAQGQQNAVRRESLERFSGDTALDTSQIMALWYAEQQKETQKNGRHYPWFHWISLTLTSTSEESMSQIDNALGDLFDTLESEQLLDHTVVIVTALNQWQENRASNVVDRETLHVPLIIAWPQRPPEVVHALTSHVDIMATLMVDALAVTNAPRQFSNGLPLWGDRKRQWIVSGSSSRLAAYFANETLLIDADGDYSVYSVLGLKQMKTRITLSEYLSVLSENRHFIVNP